MGGITAPGSRQSLGISSRVANAMLAAADNATRIVITAGTFTQTFDTPANLGNGWFCEIQNAGTGLITIPLSDGVANWIMFPGEVREFQCNGAVFSSIVLHNFCATFIATGSFPKPPGYSYFGGLAWSAGSSGEKSGNVAQGAKGGSGGGCFPFLLKASLFAATETIVVGAGGAAVTIAAVGNNGGATAIGSLLTVYGSTFSGSVGGAIGVTGAISNSTGLPVGFEAASGAAKRNTVFGGSNSSSDYSGDSGSSILGGAGGGGVTDIGGLRAPGTSIRAGNGGAASALGSGVDGVAPGGGGGATQTGAQSGAGGRGEVHIWGIA